MSGRGAGRGISPVLGAVLIIGVTVISLALVGVFVVEFTESMSTGESVAVDVHIATGNVEVQVASGRADQLVLVVDGEVEDTVTDARIGDTLYASNVGPNSQVTVFQEVGGETKVLTTTYVLPKAGAPASYETVGETGTITLSTDGGTWSHLSFENAYDEDVVVIAKPVDAPGTKPVHVRFKNVDRTTGADIKLEGWNGSGPYGPATVHYLVLERGDHTLEDGTVVRVGETQVGTTFEKVAISPSVDDTPVVFTQSQTAANPSTPVVTRVRDIQSDSFCTKIASNDGTVTNEETVGYVVVEQRRGLYRFRHESRRTGAMEIENWSTIRFQNAYGLPDRTLLMELQTFTSGQPSPAELQYERFSSSSVNVSVEGPTITETTSYASEEVGYWVINRNRDIISYGNDTGTNAGNGLGNC